MKIHHWESRQRISTIRTIAARGLRSTFYGLGIYAVLALALLVTAPLAVRNVLFQVAQNGVMVMPAPMNGPFLLTVGLLALYLGFCTSLSIARERDQGTLEVLFYGPVNGTIYVLSKYVQQLVTFLMVLGAVAVYFAGISRITHLGLAPHFPGLLLASVFMASEVVALGIFFSVITRRPFASAISFMATMGFFMAFWIVQTVIMDVPGRELTNVLVYIRLALEQMDLIVRWISPLASFGRGVLAAQTGDGAAYVMNLGSSALYTGVLLYLSVHLFRQKGVQR